MPWSSDAPLLMVLLPWFDLLTDHSLGREEEGRREVIPEGVPDEIKVLETVPRRASFVAFVGGARCRQLRNRGSSGSLNPDLAVLVDPALSLLREGHDEGAWSASVNFDEGGAKTIRMLFDLEEIDAERQPKVDSGDAFPVVESAMGLKYEVEEIGHWLSSFRRRSPWRSRRRTSRRALLRLRVAEGSPR